VTEDGTADGTVAGANETDADRRCRVAIARARAGELLDHRDIQAIWRIGRSRYYGLRANGAFDCLKTHVPIGTRIYSGVLVAKLLAGEHVYEPSTFAAKRKRRA